MGVKMKTTSKGEEHNSHPKGEEHNSHPPYVKIYVGLLVLTVLSVVISAIVHREYAPPFVFTISTIKGLLIALYYMHLKYEGRIIISLALIPLVIFAIILFIFMPDILSTVKQ